MSGKRIVFMGSPAFAVPSLRALHDAGHVIAAVYTQPPRPAGRGKALQKTAVHVAAEELGLPVFTPEKLKGADLDAVMALPCDAVCVVAYGLLLPKVLVENRLCLNVHPSSLPRWRGAAPLQWTLLGGDTRSEVCIMQLDAGMDTGPVLDRAEIEIPETMTLGQLHDLCADVGARRLAAVVDDVKAFAPVPQAEGGVTLAHKITRDMRMVDWAADARAVHNRIRAFEPSPCAVATLEGVDVKLSESAVEGPVAEPGQPGEIVAVDAGGMVVACGKGAVRIARLQKPGGSMAHASEVARGWEVLRKGARFQ